MAGLVERMIRASLLDVRLYEEVEGDRNLTSQAMLVVIISSLAAGFGGIGTFGVRGLLMGTVYALISWVVWAILTFFIGTKLLPEPQTKSDPGELLRTIGFASSPGVIRILAFIPILGWLISLVAMVWMLVTMVIAVRQALDYQSTLRAVGVCVIGWIVMIILSAIFMTPLMRLG
jgi:hypothetical protein